MSLTDILQNRRSVRRYTGEAIPEEKIKMILDAGLLAPSGRNIKPCEFILVKDKDILAKLAKSREHGAEMLEGADACIVVVADGTATDVWTEDASIAMTLMHVMADSLGVGSCWIQGRLRTASDGRTTEDYIKELLNIPDNMKLEAMLSLGIPMKHPKAKTVDEEMEKKVHIGVYDEK